jgi:hypothetical protein
LTINQSKQVCGENYIVVNYAAGTQVTAVWVLGGARDEFFSVRKPNTNARSLIRARATPHIESLHQAVPAVRQDAHRGVMDPPARSGQMLKVATARRAKRA